MPDTFILRSALLIDGTGGAELPDAAVAVEGGTISAVGPAADVCAQRPDSTVIDRGSETILPGLIDCHNHLSMDPNLPNYLSRMDDPVEEQEARAQVNMRVDLAAGVTTSRCCGDKEFLDIRCRDAVSAGEIDGPRLLVATRGLRAVHGHGFVGYPVDGPDAIRGMVRENIDAGADFIKFYITGTLRGASGTPSYLSRQEIGIIVDEAHQAGLRTTAHCVGGEGMDWAIDAGLDVIEHAYHISDEQIKRLSASGTRLVITPSPFMTEKRVMTLPQEHIAGHIEQKPLVCGRMSAAIHAGHNFGVGTDGMHGELWQEMCHLVELGCDPMRAIRAATLNAADVCGIEETVGSIQSGKAADMITVKGNPLDSMAVMKDIGLVIRSGRICGGAEATE